MTKLIAATLLVFVSGAKLLGQSSARANVTVTILEPVGAQKVEDLDFGSFAMASKPGTIELYASEAKCVQGGVRPSKDNATASMALFQIINHDLAYSITLSSTSLTVLRREGLETMQIGAVRICDPQKKGEPAGTKTLAIGATLYANAFQPVGSYSAVTPLAVTVNYN